MAAEIPIWVHGTLKWVSGVEKRTTCREVIEVLLQGEGMGRADVKDFTIMERWRRVEKPLEDTSKILKVWSHWGDEKKDVRLYLKRIENEVDSGRGSPIAGGNTPSMRRKRRSRATSKSIWNHQETLHPKRLAELEGIDKDDFEDYQLKRLQQSEVKKKSSEGLYEYRHATRVDVDCAEARKRSGHKSCPGTGTLHSTLLEGHQPEESSKSTNLKCCSKRQSKQKVRKSENIEKLMKLILAQGATIQNQLQKLKDREEQIDLMEQERHKERVEKNGRNYLLETYLGSLGEAEIPPGLHDEEEEKGNDSGVHTEGGSDQMNPMWDKEKCRLERVQVGEPSKREEETGVKRPSRRGRLKSSLEEDFSCSEESRKIEKSQRSKSESRSKEREEESVYSSQLKRTKSENTLFPKEKDKTEHAKEESEELIELKRVQSQVELWEKVFKINKRLEKEEENLVRLHIKIRRCQSENLKIAKEIQSQKESRETSLDRKGSGEDVLEEQVRSAEKDLETLRTDLDHNSKEIYKNFTQLMEHDDEVENKEKYLTKLMSDLQRSEQELGMLEEVVALPAESPIQNFQATSVTSDIGLSLQVKGQEKILKQVEEEPVLVETSVDSGSETQEVTRVKTSQRAEETDNKPKIIKISFDDQIQNSSVAQEKIREPPTTPGTIKSILKNRKQMGIDTSNINQQIQNLEKCVVNYGSNIDQKTEKMSERKDMTIPEVSQRPLPLPEEACQIYACPVNPSYNNPIYGENPYRYSFNGRTSFSRKGSRTQNLFPNTTLVTTKAMVHNDTDSSTSSDTSGLSSMYSGSPTVPEEPYGEAR